MEYLVYGILFVIVWAGGYLVGVGRERRRKSALIGWSRETAAKGMQRLEHQAAGGSPDSLKRNLHGK